jgi:asparagine N-glycosylation enzyme membrane subunit Stt3
MRVFGREPAVWVGLIEASLAMLVALSILNFTREQTAEIMAVVVAVFGVVTAYLTKDTMLGFIVGLTKAVIALVIGFGFSLSPEVTASLIAFVVVVVGFFQRTQTSPAPVPGLTSPPKPEEPVV